MVKKLADLLIVVAKMRYSEKQGNDIIVFISFFDQILSFSHKFWCVALLSVVLKTVLQRLKPVPNTTVTYPRKY